MVGSVFNTNSFLGGRNMAKKQPEASVKGIQRLLEEEEIIKVREQQ